MTVQYLKGLNIFVIMELTIATMFTQVLVMRHQMSCVEQGKGSEWRVGRRKWINAGEQGEGSERVIEEQGEESEWVTKDKKEKVNGWLESREKKVIGWQ